MADGFEEIEALAVVDILRRANIDIKTVSINDNLKVIGAHQISVYADCLVTEMGDYDAIFLPGGYPGYENLGNSKEVIRIINEANDNNKLLIAICAAPSLLGREGLLKEKSACCFPSFEKELIGADVSFDDVVIDGNIITSRGAGTAHKLGFKIVELFKGKDFADDLTKKMLY